MGTVSLVQGWLPVTLQLVAALAVVAVVVRRGDRRWWMVWVPVATVVGLVALAVVQRVATAEGVVNDPPPEGLWVWLGLTASAVVLAAAGWPGARWWRRAVAVVAVPLTVLAAGVVLNQWVAYWVTVQGAWVQISDAPLPDQVDPDVLTRPVASMPRHGAVVPVDVPDTASGFSHRTEYVYLPPAWFSGADRAQLPVVMMLGAEYSVATDWPRIGGAVVTADRFAAAHDGSAPVLVFPDASGSIQNDTECVNGPRGRSADHLTGDVRPYVVQRFGVSDSPARWAVAGFSTGGICALDLAVMHPDLFGTFDDIEGDVAPTVGTKQQTIERLFDGDAAAYDAFDPSVVMARHGPYADLVGRFDESDGRSGTGAPVPVAQANAAVKLCDEGRAVHVGCSVEYAPGGHNWLFGAVAFTRSLPWLWDRLSAPAPPSP